jgi:uncharacterized membrane protein YfcA
MASGAVDWIHDDHSRDSGLDRPMLRVDPDRGDRARARRRSDGGAEVGPVNWYAVLAVGAGVGFLGGLFGKGGSAVATPLLAAIGVPAFVAVAAPLPATVPSTAIASWAYWRHRLIDRRIVIWSLAVGVPATALGAVTSRWVDGHLLVVLTDVVVAGLGLRFVLARTPAGPSPDLAPPTRARLVAVALATGLAAGLMANSGGFLLAPLYVAVLRLPLKQAFACSLAVSVVLAVPGTVVHAALGHIDWEVVVVFATASVPLSYVGARVAIRSDPHRLERFYGVVLFALGVTLLVLR